MIDLDRRVKLAKEMICPDCGGELDTGWECTDCGADAIDLIVINETGGLQ